MFLTPPVSAARIGAPKRFLAAYEKLHLSPHQSKNVSLAYYDRALYLAQPDGSMELVEGQWVAELSTGGRTQPATAKFVVRRKHNYGAADD